MHVCEDFKNLGKPWVSEHFLLGMMKNDLMLFLKCLSHDIETQSMSFKGFWQMMALKLCALQFPNCQ